jgi:simple sugar transport system permease protein
MAAVFIGGTAISGGKGSIVGTFFGAYIVGCVEAGVVASGLSGFWTRLVVGLIFLGAVIVHVSLEQPGRFRRLAGMRTGGVLAGSGKPPD